MPSYEYHCPHCEHQFEQFSKTFRKRHPRTCPECKEKGLEHLIGGKTIGRVKGQPKTFGQQAEINEKRMGKEQMQLMKEADTARMKSGWTGPVPKGAKLVQKEVSKEIPFYREGLPDPSKPLDVTKVKNLDKYVLTGEMK